MKFKTEQPAPQEKEKSTIFDDGYDGELEIDYTNSKEIIPYEIDSDGKYVLRCDKDSLQSMHDIAVVMFNDCCRDIDSDINLINNYSKASMRSRLNPIKRRIEERKSVDPTYNYLSLIDEINGNIETPVGCKVLDIQEIHNISGIMNAVGSIISNLSHINGCINVMRVTDNNPNLDIADLIYFGDGRVDNFASMNSLLLGRTRAYTVEDILTSELATTDNGFSVKTNNEAASKKFELNLTNEAVQGIFDAIISKTITGRLADLPIKDEAIKIYYERFPRK